MSNYAEAFVLGRIRGCYWAARTGLVRRPIEPWAITGGVDPKSSLGNRLVDFLRTTCGETVEFMRVESIPHSRLVRLSIGISVQSQHSLDSIAVGA